MGRGREGVLAFALIASCVIDLALALHGAPFAVSGLATPRGGFTSESRKLPTHVVPLRGPSQQPIEGLRGGEDENITGLVVSLVKNIVGSGILALPAGLAAFSDSKSVSGLAIVLAGFAAAFAGYCFSLVGKVCLATNSTTYKEAWVKSIGSSTAWIPTFFVASKTFIACLCYSIIIADLLRDLASSLGAQGLAGNRDALLVTCTVTVLLPLCMLRSFAALKMTSLLGILGTLASIAHMTYRWFQGDYAPGGSFYDRIPALDKPKFEVKGSSALKSLILISTLTSSYFAHYNAPKFLNEIKHGDRQGKFNKLAMFGFGGSFFFNTVMMITGFLTFGGACKGLILNNYASADQLANMARFGVLLSVIFGYPHSYVGFRDGLIGPNGQVDQKFLDAFAVVTLTILTLLATKVRDLGVVVALFGALLGSSIVYVFPAMMMIAIKRKGEGSGVGSVSYGQDYYINVGVASVGMLLGALGVAIVLLKNFTDILK